MIKLLVINWALIGLWLTWDKMDDYHTTLVEKLTGFLLVSVFGSILFVGLVIFEVIHFATRSWEK